jgi:hypothetical protein
MINNLNDYSSFQRYKVMNGISKDCGDVCSEYILERKIIRIVNEEMSSEENRTILRKCITKSDKNVEAQIQRIINLIERMRGEKLSYYYKKICESRLETILEIYNKEYNRQIKNRRKNDDCDDL